MARTMGPRGVHIAYLVIDAAIDLEWQRKNNPDKPDDYFCHPNDIADSIQAQPQIREIGYVRVTIRFCIWHSRLRTHRWRRWRPW